MFNQAVDAYAGKTAEPAPRQWWTLFLSDVHLGTRGCQAQLLLDFIRRNKAGKLYFVGDIIDFWRLKRFSYFPQSHNDVLQKILREVRAGAEGIFIPGNHDEIGRDYLGYEFGGVKVVNDAIHRTMDGKEFLVIHGDLFDVACAYAKWLVHLGDWAYTWALRANIVCAYVRRKLGLPYWSLSAYLKVRTKRAVNFMGAFEHYLAAEARRRGVDGVICGHIHHAQMREIEGILYCNIGDFVESCTAIGEDFNGQLHLIRWQTRGVSSRSGTNAAQAPPTEQEAGAESPCVA